MKLGCQPFLFDGIRSEKCAEYMPMFRECCVLLQGMFRACLE